MLEQEISPWVLTYSFAALSDSSYEFKLSKTQLKRHLILLRDANYSVYNNTNSLILLGSSVKLLSGKCN